MSFAPASSRGIFLKARLAVNGIQCAARSFGTLTAGRGGLLSSIGCLFGFGVRDLRGTLSASHAWRNRRCRELLQARAADWWWQEGGLPHPAGAGTTRAMADKPKKPQKLRARLPRGLED